MEAVARTQGMTMVFRISGGIQAKFESFVIFKHAKRAYPIRVSPDNIEGASYRTQHSGWMDGVKFNK